MRSLMFKDRFRRSRLALERLALGRVLVGSLACLALSQLLAPPAADAAGLFLAPRGVVPLGRAGAQVAGAEDLHALGYNPAGLLRAPGQVLLDAAVPMWRGRWTPASGESAVDADSLNLPSPTLGMVSPRWAWGRLGLAWSGEYSTLQNWPEGPDSPARYAAGSFHGTTLSKVSLGAAWQPLPWLDIGVAAHSLVGNFVAVNTISLCEGVACPQPKDPDYDARARMRSSPLWVPGVGIGATLRPLRWLAVGLSWESGYTLDTPVELDIALPAAAIFQTAVISPADLRARLVMQLPQQLRVGVQAEVVPDVRVELAAVWEPWHVHDTLQVSLGEAQVSVLGVDHLRVRDLTVGRHFRDSYSVRLGGDWRLLPGTTLRGGVMYEPSAIPDAYLSPMTVDLDKIIASVGLGVGLGARWRLEAVYAHVFGFSRDVTGSRVLQLNPIEPSNPAVAVGDGHYEARGDILGLGLSWQM